MPGTGMDTTLLDIVSKIAQDGGVRALAEAEGLNITTVSWEDTGRYKGSSVGPNISDMTLRVDGRRMPMIRRPNFGDVSCDTPIEMHTVKVGNENGGELKEIPLRQLLEKIGMWLDRDQSILSTTQACVLPLKDGKVEFSVQLFNYQYDEEDPAVLTIVASDQGTSVTVVTEPDQVLNFNKNGTAADFLAQRLTDFRAETGSTATGAMTADEADKNMLRVYQVPLKQTKPKTREVFLESACFSMAGGGMMEKSMAMPAAMSRGFEDAILSTGEGKGPYNGIEGRKLVRDERFPIRCTYQYYKVTDVPEVPYELLRVIKAQLSKLYDEAEARGSLVTTTENRETEPDLPEVSTMPTPIVCPQPVPIDPGMPVVKPELPKFGDWCGTSQK